MSPDTLRRLIVDKFSELLSLDKKTLTSLMRLDEDDLQKVLTDLKLANKLNKSELAKVKKYIGDISGVINVLKSLSKIF